MASGALTTSLISTPTFYGWIIGQLTVGQFYNPDALRHFGVGVLNGSLWTIPVELQFYVTYPFSLLAVPSWRAGLRGTFTLASWRLCLTRFGIGCRSMRRSGQLTFGTNCWE